MAGANTEAARLAALIAQGKDPRVEKAAAMRRDAAERAAAGLPHTTLHGLRRSFGTLAEWVECPVGIVAQIQGHKPSAIAEKHYRVRPLDLLRLWHERIEVWMLTEAGIEAPQSGQGGTRVAHRPIICKMTVYSP